MFVITIGPLHKQWSKVVKVLAVLVALALVALVAWKIWGSVAQPEIGNIDEFGQEVMVFGKSLASGIWQRFLTTLEQWFRFGF